MCPLWKHTTVSVTGNPTRTRASQHFLLNLCFHDVPHMRSCSILTPSSIITAGANRAPGCRASRPLHRHPGSAAAADGADEWQSAWSIQHASSAADLPAIPGPQRVGSSGMKLPCHTEFHGCVRVYARQSHVAQRHNQLHTSLNRCITCLAMSRSWHGQRSLCCGTPMRAASWCGRTAGHWRRAASCRGNRTGVTASWMTAERWALQLLVLRSFRGYYGP